MGPALFTRASGLPRAVAAPLQILAERRANRQCLRRSQFVLLVSSNRGIRDQIACPPVTPSVGCEMEFARTRDILQQRRRMKMPKRLIDCLDENKASYEILRHPE